MSDNINKRLPFDSNAEIRYVQPPDPSWHPGDGAGHEALAESWEKATEKGWKSLRPDDHTAFDYYRILKSGVIPRPVAFVSSISANGIPNLAPFSFFNMVSQQPPILLFSASPKAAAEKDTIQNIRDNKQFTVNIISEPWIKASNFASMEMPSHISEWAATGLTMMDSTLVKPAWVRQTAFAMECEVFQFIEIPKPESSIAASELSTVLVMGYIKLVHVRNAVLNERGTIDPTLLRPLARLGGYTYGVLGQVFDLPTPSWENYKGEILALEKKKSEEEANGRI